MPQSLFKVLVHCVFSTKYRQPLIDETIAQDLYNYLWGICVSLEAHPFQIGGYKDHVHVLCVLSKKVTGPKLMEELKKGSSKWIKSRGVQYSNFYWQDGYAMFSVNPHDADRVIAYIRNQVAHHQKKKSFQDECRELFRDYNVEFDERYFWD